MNTNSLRLDLEKFINWFDSQYNYIHFNHQSDDQLETNQCKHHLSDNLKDFETTKRQKKNKAVVNINHFRIQLQSFLKLLSQFKNLLNELNTCIDCEDDNKWLSLVNELNQQKIVISDQLVTINQMIPNVKYKINKNRRKRQRKSKEKEILKNMKIDININRNQIIGEWIQSLNNSNEKSDDYENDLKREANKALNDVKNKIMSTKKYLKRVNALERLRNALKNRYQQQSGKEMTPQSEELFIKEMNRLKHLLKDRLEMYRKEDRRIKSMVEQQECVEQQKDNKSLSKSELYLYECLFGNQSIHDLKSGSQSLQNMINIRNRWDNYIDIQSGTHIPIHWVIPNCSSNDDWIKYQIH
ncbi:programmed cell death protein 7-like [Oppia nitens]|uniref:programmed cell death protein 7-like n=1 Tax=Oppia nitens TaxID=1686743 RepID=UPI0023DAA500|nr:programmed cell death protein 7-like [Oppia nitens]